MNVIAGELVGCNKQQQHKGALSGLVAQMVEPGALELGTTIAIVTEDVLLGQTPVRLGGDIAPQARQLLLDRVGLLLSGGRDPSIERDSHGRPPEKRRAGAAWRRRPPNRAGVGRRDPTAVARQDGARCHGRYASYASLQPPAGGICRRIAKRCLSWSRGSGPRRQVRSRVCRWVMQNLSLTTIPLTSSS